MYTHNFELFDIESKVSHTKKGDVRKETKKSLGKFNDHNELRNAISHQQEEGNKHFVAVHYESRRQHTYRKVSKNYRVTTENYTGKLPALKKAKKAETKKE